MENTLLSKFVPGNTYEIVPGNDNVTCYKIEILCNTINSRIRLLRVKERETLTNTYLLQCNLLIEEVLEYIRHQKKTNIQFIKKFDQGAYEACKNMHLKEVKSLQEELEISFNIFNEALYFIFPENEYPEHLLPLQETMKMLEDLAEDLFQYENSRLSPKLAHLPYTDSDCCSPN